MLREVKSRILLEEDVIKAVDKHTNDDGTLDNDISCILEEVKSVVIMGSKEVMSNLKTDNTKYQFNVGDYVETIDGHIGYIDFICDCSECQRRGWLEPHVIYPHYDSDYIYRYEVEEPTKYYKRIGKYEFVKKTPIIKSVDSIIVTGTTDDDGSFKVSFTEFDEKSGVEVKDDNGTLSLIINGSYSKKIEY